MRRINFLSPLYKPAWLLLYNLLYFHCKINFASKNDNHAKISYLKIQDTLIEQSVIANYTKILNTLHEIFSTKIKHITVLYQYTHYLLLHYACYKYHLHYAIWYLVVDDNIVLGGHVVSNIVINNQSQ